MLFHDKECSRLCHADKSVRLGREMQTESHSLLLVVRTGVPLEVVTLGR